MNYDENSGQVGISGRQGEICPHLPCVANELKTNYADPWTLLKNIQNWLILILLH